MVAPIKKIVYPDGTLAQRKYHSDYSTCIDDAMNDHSVKQIPVDLYLHCVVWPWVTHCVAAYL